MPGARTGDWCRWDLNRSRGRHRGRDRSALRERQPLASLGYRDERRVERRSDSAIILGPAGAAAIGSQVEGALPLDKGDDVCLVVQAQRAVQRDHLTLRGCLAPRWRSASFHPTSHGSAGGERDRDDPMACCDAMVRRSCAVCCLVVAAVSCSPCRARRVAKSAQVILARVRADH